MVGWDRIGEVLRAAGTEPRGGFHPQQGDGVPTLADGGQVLTLVLAGGVGGSLWPVFGRSPELADGLPHALDRWSRRVLDETAATLGAQALYPFVGPPHLPFQRWAMRAEPSAPSPLGILIHPDHGLWHSYRGALAFADKLELPAREERPSPCETCADRPCLSTCPVAAFSGKGYDVVACLGHIGAEAGADCMARSCLARRACPIGRSLAHGPEQSAFHMRAFRRALTARSG